MPVTELVRWYATDAFLSDLPSTFGPMVKIYTGVEVEDNTSFWMVVVWQSHEHHQAMMNRPDYPDMVARLKPFFRDGQLKMDHVEFNGDSDNAFGSPITLLSFMRVRTGHTVEELERRLQATCNRESSTRWGQTHEDARMVIGITGCTDSKVSDATNMGKDNNPFPGLNEVADIRSLSVKFVKEIAA
ncbi:hypothetical protein D9613_006133 [Agrocybe pediades]|uniref:ABM domain-containing protein n=1 Tax=Agrocybe pediades TaxID=84607 RepID=A0A8H4VPB5_9AGAR|nr:hypothetical protein D9613_006133 [Agrocybe pediades]